MTSGGVVDGAGLGSAVGASVGAETGALFVTLVLDGPVGVSLGGFPQAAAKIATTMTRDRCALLTIFRSFVPKCDTHRRFRKVGVQNRQKLKKTDDSQTCRAQIEPALENCEEELLYRRSAREEARRNV
jgi:hypothetical protein